MKEKGRKKGKKGGREGERERGRYHWKLWLYKGLILFLKLNGQVHLRPVTADLWTQLVSRDIFSSGKKARKDGSCTGLLSSLHFPPQPGTAGNVWLPLSNPRISQEDFKTIPLQTSKMSRPELGSGFGRGPGSKVSEAPILAFLQAIP